MVSEMLLWLLLNLSFLLLVTSDTTTSLVHDEVNNSTSNEKGIFSKFTLVKRNLFNEVGQHQIQTTHKKIDSQLSMPIHNFRRITSESCDFSSPTSRDSIAIESSSNISNELCTSKLSTSMAQDQRQIYRGDFLCSPNKMYQFGLTREGKLSLCKNEIKIWSAALMDFDGEASQLMATSTSASFASLESDGNFVVYSMNKWSPSSSSSSSSKPFILWQTNSIGNEEAAMEISNDGTVTIRNEVGEMLWSLQAKNFIINELISTQLTEQTSSTVTASVTTNNDALQYGGSKCNFMSVSHCLSTLSPNSSLRMRTIHKGEYLCSRNENFKFGLTNSGKLSLCENDRELWSKNFRDGDASFASLQRDGNFVVYEEIPSGKSALWATDTNGNDISELTIKNNGKVKIKTINGKSIWTINAETLNALVPEPNYVSDAQDNNPSSIDIGFDPLSSDAFSHNQYQPGKLFFDPKTGLHLSQGLRARIVATSGRKVAYGNGKESQISFHQMPDAGACFQSDDGGWTYLSNSEVGGNQNPDGGVGKIKFNAFGEIQEYKMVLENTRMNCGGGKTPWGTWITCEEYKGTTEIPAGQCFEVHPDDLWNARQTYLGGIEGGKFESAAFDHRDMKRLKAFVTHDSSTGELRRFTPDSEVLENAIESSDFSQVLHKPGLIEYLVLIPSSNKFKWTKDIEEGKMSASHFFPNAEGIDCHDGFVYFVSKKRKELIILNLDSLEYKSWTTLSGAFDGQPDQIVRLIGHENRGKSHEIQYHDSLLYFTEDGGPNAAGVYARDQEAQEYYTILRGGINRSDETTGLSFCDDGKRMICAFQDEGILYEIVRQDGLSFHGNTVDIKYHHT